MEITTNDIEMLRQEAAAAGDTKQVASCDMALNGHEYEYLQCLTVIREARAESAHQDELEAQR